LPLFEKARVEVYLPDQPKPTYQNLLDTLDQEFTFAFGGATTVRGLEGSYLSRLGLRLQDRINLIYTDTPFSFEAHFERLSQYADILRRAAFDALEEEAVLVAVLKVYHSE
jgi:hypothetical protein